MRKTVPALILMVSLLFSGCMMTPFSTGVRGEPVDSSFKDAHAYAEYWMGPCKEIDEYDGNESVIHEMRDKDLGFTYTVVESDVSSGIGSHVMYYSEDFGHYYLEAFLQESDVVKKLDKMDLGLSVRVNELKISKDTGMILPNTPTLIIETDEKLSDEDAKEIISMVKDELEDFDDRGYFTKSEKTDYASIDLRCAPWSSDAGKKYHSWQSIYDQDHP